MYYQKRLRIVHEEKNLYTLKSVEDHKTYKLPKIGKFIYQLEQQGKILPTVGDYLLCETQGEGNVKVIDIFPRQTALSRKIGEELDKEQTLAANVDTVFLLNSLNFDLNLRRIERYLVMIKDGGIEPVLVLTKADLVSLEDREQYLSQVKEIAPHVPIHVTTIKNESSFKFIDDYLFPKNTIALVGSSGVGKSTLTNFLLGKNIQKIQDIGNDRDRGRHTTTTRSLFELKNGSFLIDTPGIREIQLWEGDKGIDDLFSDIQKLESSCHFRNCSHVSEPNCQILLALKNGALDPSRYKSYIKLKREQAYMSMKVNAKEQRHQKEIWKRRTKIFRRDLRKNRNI